MAPTLRSRVRLTRYVAAAVIVLTGALTSACKQPMAATAGGPFSFTVAYTFPSLSPTDFITTFDFTSDGTLWAVSFEGVILRVRQGQTVRYEAASVLGSSQLRDLFIDGTGRVWVTAGNAVAVFDGETWTRQDPPSFMGMSPKVWDVAVNAAGDLLLGVGDADAGGLLLRHSGQWQALTPNNSTLPSPLESEIAVAPDGSFWVASAQFQGRGGVTRIVGDHIAAVFDVARNGLLYNGVDDLAIAGGQVWMGFAARIYEVPGFADGGMQSMPLQGGPPTTWYPAESALSSNRVESLIRSSAGDLWFTTSVDDDNQCQTCVASIGMIDASGRFEILSHLNSALAANEYLPQIREGADAAIYVSRTIPNQIVRILR